jgi:hypothetical protein
MISPFLAPVLRTRIFAGSPKRYFQRRGLYQITPDPVIRVKLAKDAENGLLRALNCFELEGFGATNSKLLVTNSKLFL